MPKPNNKVREEKTVDHLVDIIVDISKHKLDPFNGSKIVRGLIGELIDQAIQATEERVLEEVEDAVYELLEDELNPLDGTPEVEIIGENNMDKARGLVQSLKEVKQ